MYWNQLHEQAREQGVPLTVVATEALHLPLLESLFGLPESQKLHFQGGTSLYLLHGGYRYSEDLDLAVPGINGKGIAKLVTRARERAQSLTQQLLGPGEFAWKEPADEREGPVWAHWFRFEPANQAGLAHLKVKLEFADFPVYQPLVLPAKSSFDVLGLNPLVNGLGRSELLAEKVTALLGRPYLKARDLFDIWFLGQVKGVELSPTLLLKKTVDYHLDCDPTRLAQRLQESKRMNLKREMELFLPLRYRRQLKADNYRQIRESALQVAQEAVTLLTGGGAQ